jgi:hypothetical protein
VVFQKDSLQPLRISQSHLVQNIPLRSARSAFRSVAQENQKFFPVPSTVCFTICGHQRPPHVEKIMAIVLNDLLTPKKIKIALLVLATFAAMC